jgi:two-component system, sensor histidine kinase
MPSYDRETLLELITLHERALRRMPWVEAALVLAISLFMLPFVPVGLFLGWGVLTVGVESVRAVYARRVVSRGSNIDPVRAHQNFVLLATAAGAAVGIGAMLFLPRLPIIHQALFGGILFAMPAAGVGVSQSSRHMLAGYALAILIPGCITWIILHPEQAPALTGLTCLYFVVIVLAAADGDKLLVRSVAIRHQRDQLVRDLEQRNEQVRTAMAAAEQSAQARARVLAAASHDLRQPLHALSVYTAVLAANPGPQALREATGNIDLIVRGLGSLLHGLLDLSRLSAGHYALDKQAVSMDSVIRGVCSEFESAAAAKGLSLAVRVSPVTVLGDALAIGRIARNLLDNALKYTEQGSVTLSVDRDESAAPPVAILSVSDTGKGIPASEHSRIFEEFYQLDNPGRDRSKGVGLGLAIVQRLCELSEATVSVTSELGRGTCFRLCFPLASAEGPSPALFPVAGEDFPLRGLRLYLVDDEAEILRSMSQLLTAWGMRIWVADCIARAEEIFEQQGAPDLMITDLRLGEGEHGAELAVRMRAKVGGFPVLIITGETSSDSLREAGEQGFTLLHKPVAPEALRHAMIAAVNPAPPQAVSAG